MKTIAEQLNIKDFPFIIKDKEGNKIYYEDLDGYWWKREYDANRNVTYFKDHTGFWWKAEYDSNNETIFYENSIGWGAIDKRKAVSV